MKSTSLSQIGRREALALLAGAGSLAGASLARAQTRDPLSGAAMMEDVKAYDALGEHRTATAADDATSLWLARRLGQAGLKASLQPFRAPLFVPARCELRVADQVVPAFPGWPVTATPEGGVSAPLAAHDDPAIAGKIAVARLPYRQGGSWAAHGFGDLMLQIAVRGPSAIVAVTEGPTGGVIALNAVPSRFRWPVPVVIAGGRYGEQLSSLAAGGAPARLVSTGTSTPAATATNVVARRPGRGETLVVSTPKSGWFHCAGERGTGVAVFIALAGWLARRTDADLLFVAFSGHELDEMGGAHFMATAAPAPQSVRVWLHIGANAAMQPLSVANGVARPVPPSGPDRRVTATPSALGAAQRAFTAAAGYGAPRLINEVNAVGELSIFRTAGYQALAGLLGANPLFHTRADRADVATTPAVLARVAGAARDFLGGFAA